MKNCIFLYWIAAATCGAVANAEIARTATDAQTIQQADLLEPSRGQQLAKLLIFKERERDNSARAFILGAYLVKKAKMISDTSTNVISAPIKGKSSAQ